MKPFLHDTARTVMDIMQPAYPELGEAEAFITNVIENEEIRFSETLDNGLRVLNDALNDLRASGETKVSGDVIFKLYDTYGFPVDIVRDVVRDEKLELDMAGFDAAMDRQRAQSRAKVTFAEIGDAYRPLSAQGFQPAFKGYEDLTVQSRVVLLVKDGAEVAAAESGDAVEMVVEATPFYGEAGGQVGDVGTITGLAGEPAAQMDVQGTIKDPTGLIIHKGIVTAGRIVKDDMVRLQVDMAARQATARNHTATHILHAILREVLGDHVKQAGSLVAADRLRFDFTHFSQIKPEELATIERKVNQHIMQNVATHTDEMDADEAFQSGATALFEEKYGDRVRVVSLADFSKELCGGTHVKYTGDIGFFKILTEASVAAGVRRIEATTGDGALASVQQMVHALNDAARLLKDSPQNLTPRIEKMLAHQKQVEKENETLKARLASRTAAEAETDVREIKGVKVLARRVEADNPGALRDLVDRFRDRLGSGVVILGGVSANKALLIAGVTPDLMDRYHAGKIIKALAPIVGGGGGGKSDLAQAGGSQPEHLDKALAQAYEVVAGS